jgi:hypothetical protein
MGLFDKRLIDQLLKCNSTYMLGVLATEENTYPGIGEKQEAVTPEKNNDRVVFYIKSISTDPDPITEYDTILETNYGTSVFIGFDNFLKPGLLPSGYVFNRDVYKRTDILQKHLSGSLIIFKPFINYDNEKDRLYKNLEILNIEKDIPFSVDTEYVPVPIMKITANQFEQKLRAQEAIDFEDYSHVMRAPEWVICGDYIYTNFGKGWKTDPYKKTTWRHTMPESIRKLKIEKAELNSKSIMVTNGLKFINNEYLIAIEKKLDIEGIPLGELEDSVDTINEEANEEKVQILVSDPLELQFLKNLEEYALREKLSYDESDLVNFHISMKTNALTILSGMSGTGKTRLALTYASCLGLSQENKTLLIVPVNPSYTEPGDLLGYLNTGIGLYMPSDSGLVDFLVHASRNPDKLHMIIFEEMNLSQVEHWFAPFISLLELDPIDRKLQLYSEFTNCHNAAQYPQIIPIGDNILIVGTVNMDETTKDFSDRLLDRANVVSPRKQDFSFARKKFDDFKGKITSERELSEWQNDIFGLTKTYRNWLAKDKDPWDAYTDNELEFFDNLHKLIQEYDPQKGVSFRIITRIGNYLNNIPKGDDGTPKLQREEAIDILVKQRILTKIRGSAEQFESLIGTLPNPNEELKNSKLYTFFNSDQAKAISPFTRTIAEIRRKARELHTNGYAS